MNSKELDELHRLGRLWATGKATKKQILRHMELSRSREFELKQQKEKKP